MIIDTHVHYWEAPRADRPHDAEGVPLGHELTAEQLLNDAAATGIDRIVQITPALMGFDNRYALEAAERYSNRIVGVFGRFDPLAASVGERLAECMVPKKMLGIRLTLHQPPFSSWLEQNLLEDFFIAAQKQKVPVQIFAPFLTADMMKMAERYRGIQFLVDHTAVRRMDGHPNRFAHWPHLINLGRQPNIWLKVSYFPEAAPDDERFPFPSSYMHFQALYEEIGSSQMIWGSNYPPVQRACSYAQALDFIQTSCDFLTEADKKAILSENFMAYLKAASGIDY